MAGLEEQRDSLYTRLEAGYAKIERGLRDGQDVTTWEDFWVSLLREYEAVCDALTADLAAGEVRDHVGAQLDARQETQGRWTEQRLIGVR